MTAPAASNGDASSPNRTTDRAGQHESREGGPTWSLSLPFVLLLGLVVREMFSFWTGHPYDFEVWLRTGAAVAHGSNPYANPWPPIPGVSIAFANESLPSAAYPPIWPLMVGALYRVWGLVGHGNRFVLYFLVKQPGILADVLTIYLLHRLVQSASHDPSKALRAATFWALFPYPIVITAIWGQFDSIVVCLILAALIVRDPVRRNLLWGVGVLVKWLTAIFAPLELFRERGLRRLGFLLVLVIPVAVTVLTFAAMGWSLQQFTAGTISQSQGGGNGMNFGYLFSISQVSVPLTPVPYVYMALSWAYLPGVAVAGWVGAGWLRRGVSAGELRALMLVVVLFLLLRFGLYEQYLLYIFALLVLDVFTLHPGRRTFLWFLFALTSLDLLFNNDFGYRFLSPLSAGIWPDVVALDSTSGYGVVRFYALLVLAVAVGITLIQLSRTIVLDEPAPVPWLLAWIPRRGVAVDEPGSR